MQTQEHIAIVGAGLVGSLLALNLSQRGYRVEVYERRADPRKQFKEGGRSINLALSNRGWRALDAVGLSQAVEEFALPMSGRQIHPLQESERFSPYGKDGEAIYSVSRAGLNLMLLEKADEDPHVKLHFEHRSLEPDLDELCLRFDCKGSIVERRYDRILGTDGAFSAIRTAMMKKPRFNYEQQYLDHGYKELRIPPKANGDFALRPDALHIWPRKDFMMIALPNPDHSFTCTLFMRYEGEHAFANITDEQETIAFFEQQFPDAVSLMPTLVEDFFQNPTAPLVTIRCAPWNYGHGVLLLGDASHAIVPFYGQGMNSGFEDVHELMQQLDQDQHNWTTSIPGFARQRKPKADAIAELALHNFIEMRDLVDDPYFLRKRKLEQAIWNAFPQQWTPLYSMVTFSHFSYYEALERGKKQEQLLEDILSRENAETLMEEPEVSFKARIQPYLVRLYPEVLEGETA